MATKTILLTSGTTWTVPADLDTAVNITVTAIGGGAGGSRRNATTTNGAGGGGGGGLSSASISLSGFTPGTSVTYINIGANGTGATTAGTNGTAGGQTWFNKAANSAPTSSTNGVLAKGGGAPNGGNAGAGASTTGAIGTTRYAGGAGGNATSGGGNDTGGGGGGAAAHSAGATIGAGSAGGNSGGTGGGGGGGGGHTTGANGSNTGGAGGSGGNNSSNVSPANGGTAGGGAGGAGSNGAGGGGGGGRNTGTPAGAGGAGGAGDEISITAGGTAGGGGGGGGGGGDNAAASTGGAGAAAGNYGGGGGGGGAGVSSSGVGGNGAQGAIIITYTLVTLNPAYWVGGTGTWDATTSTNWASSSGGTGGVGVPETTSAVIFDNNSNVGTGSFTVTANGGVCGDLTISGLDGAMTLAPTTSGLSIYGTTSLPATNLTISGAAAITFRSTTSKNITSNGITWNCPITFDGVSGTWVLQDNLTVGATRTTTLTNGTLDLNGFTFNAGASFTTGSGTKNLTFNGGTLTCPAASTTAFNNANPTGFTTTAGTGTGKISMTAATAKTFVGGGSTYDCTLENAGAGALTISGNNTFTTISNSVQPTTFTFTAGSTQTVTNFNVSGTSGNQVTINSTSPGSPFTLSKSTGTVDVSFCTISDSTASGDATWNALLSNGNIDEGNNSGWIFILAFIFSDIIITDGILITI